MFPSVLAHACPTCGPELPFQDRRVITHDGSVTFDGVCCNAQSAAQQLLADVPQHLACGESYAAFAIRHPCHDCGDVGLSLLPALVPQILSLAHLASGGGADEWVWVGAVCGG